MSLWCLIYTRMTSIHCSHVVQALWKSTGLCSKVTSNRISLRTFPRHFISYFCSHYRSVPYRRALCKKHLYRVDDAYSVSLQGLARCISIHDHRHSATTVINELFNGCESPTVAEAASILCEAFEDEGISESQCSAEYIIAHCIGHKTLAMVDKQKTLNATQMQKVVELAERRLQHVPIQYVLGEWDFRDVTLLCRHPVFIPRPETEELITHALQDPVVQSAKIFLEIGCGTGAISIALLRDISKARCVAVDKSLAACQLTEENAGRLTVADRLKVLHGDFMYEPLNLEKFDFIISNPPYVPETDMVRVQPELRYEDRDALCGGTDGLTIIRNILQSAAQLLKPQGSIWLEIDDSHPDQIEYLVRSNPSWKLYYQGTHMDFASKPRFCHLLFDPDRP